MVRRLLILPMLLVVLASLPGCIIHEPAYYPDDRGYYYEPYYYGPYYPYYYGPYLYAPFWFGGNFYFGDHDFHGHRGFDRHGGGGRGRR